MNNVKCLDTKQELEDFNNIILIVMLIEFDLDIKFYKYSRFFQLY